MTDTEQRVIRIEAKQEALDTYLPALLSAMERSQSRVEESVARVEARVEAQMSALRTEVAAREERIENAVRFTRLERWTLVVAIFAIPVSIIFTALA